jgi:hypothetical protein
MQFDLKRIIDMDLDVAKAEEGDHTVATAEPVTEMTAYDFDYWVERDRPPYCV